MEPTTSLTTQLVLVVLSTHYAILYLVSMESTTLLTTQHAIMIVVLVVLSVLIPILELASLEPTNSPTTLQMLQVVQSTQKVIAHFTLIEAANLLTTQQTTVVVQFISVTPLSPFCLTQPCCGKIIMQNLEEPSMSVISLTPSFTALKPTYVQERKNASFNSLARICPMVSMFNLFSRTTLLMMQEVCYMVVQ